MRDNPILKNPTKWQSSLIHRVSGFVHGVSIVILSGHPSWMSVEQLLI
jgi:hypothetical protein